MKRLTLFALTLSFLFTQTPSSFAEKAAAKKPVAPKAAASKAAANTKVEKWTYDILFRGSKVGRMFRTETTYPSGKVVVKSNSASKIKIFFSTYKGKMVSTTVHEKGKLVKADISGIQRNKPYSVKVVKTAKGLKVSVTKGKRTKTKVFAAKDYDATSAGLRLPMHPKGKKLTRRLLQLDQLKIIKQKLTYRRYIKKKIGTKTHKFTEVRARGARGKATMLFTKQGWMRKMAVRISIFGSFEIKLRSHKVAS